MNILDPDIKKEINEAMLALGLDYMQAYYYVRQKKTIIDRRQTERSYVLGKLSEHNR